MISQYSHSLQSSIVLNKKLHGYLPTHKKIKWNILT